MGKKGAPYNAVVIMVDQMRATASHLWGNPDCRTPNLEKLSRKGVLYSNAFTPHPLCVPARVSLWSSQYTHTHGGRRNETFMPPETLHAFEVWKQLGYTTGLIGKNHCFKEPGDLDLFDVWCEITHRGFEDRFPVKGMQWFRPEGKIEEAHSVRQNMPKVNPVFSYAFTEFPLEDYSTGLITGQTVRFLEANRDRPFALWVSYPDPHMPYEAPVSYASQFNAESLRIPEWRENEEQGAPERNRVLKKLLGVEDYPREDLKRFMVAYYAMIRFIDDGVGRIMEALEALDLHRNTVVVFCSDHGDFAGEHGMVSKGGAFYDSMTRIPLIFCDPGRSAAGQIEESMVNLIDIVPTLFRLQGQDLPRSFQGRPLPGITDEPPREYAFSEYGAGGPAFTMDHLAKLPGPYGRAAVKESLQWREAEGRRKMVRSLKWKYVHDPCGDRDELYDLTVDPNEHFNVADRPEHREVLRKLQRELLDWSIRTEGGTTPTPLPEPDKYRMG